MGKKPAMTPAVQVMINAGLFDKNGKPTQEYLDSLPKGDEFQYAVGFRWDENKGDKSPIGFYSYHSEIQFGNMASAEKFRDYCTKQSDKDPKRIYRIYKLAEIPDSESK